MMRLMSEDRGSGGVRKVAIAVVLLLTVAACSGTEAPSDDAVADAGTASEVAEGTAPGADEGSEASIDDDAASGPADEGNRDGTLRIGSVIAPRSLDPHTGPTVASNAALRPLYDTLVAVGSDLEFEPMLATAWEFAEDGSSIVLELRDDVDFHDGSHFDASVVEANIERGKTLEQSTYVRGQLDAVEAVEVIDDYTVRLDFAEGRGANILYVLSDMSGMMISPAGMEAPDLDVTSAGSGPYVLDPDSEYTPGEFARFIRAEEYWGPEGAAPVAVYEHHGIIDEATRLNALQGGQIDLATGLTGPRINTAEELAQTGDFQLATYDTTSVLMYYLNLDTLDVDVRRAIAFAIDREGISEAIFGGQCSPTNQLPAEGQPGYSPDLEGSYTYDPEQAQQLLDQAGAADLNLTGSQLAISPYDAAHEVVQAQLAQVGITLALNRLPTVEATTLFGSGEADVYTAPSSGGLDPGVGLLASTFIGPSRQVVGERPAEVQTAAEGLLDPALSDEERDAVAEEVNRVVTELAVQLPLCRIREGFAANSSVTGLQDMRPAVAYADYEYDIFGITE